MWIDTHCHLDAPEFDADRDAVVERALAAQVSMLVIPAVEVAGFAQTQACARRYGFAYALGIHPLFVERAEQDDIERLRDALDAARGDPLLVAVGEIGIDYFVEGLDHERQHWFYAEQLKLARRFDLPVIVHVRRSADMLLKYLRRIDVAGGIAHAFNGSAEQAQRFVERGFKLGFGGSSTYAGSRRIRQHAQQLPAEALVVETDAPDIPPQWLRQDGQASRNESSQLPRIAAGIAQLRGIPSEELAAITRTNAWTALPRLAALMQMTRLTQLTEGA